MNSRTIARELAFLAIGQITNSSELTPDELIFAATRSLRSMAKNNVKFVREDLEKLGNYFFNIDLLTKDPSVLKELPFELADLQDKVSKLEESCFAVKEALDLPILLNHKDESFEYAKTLVTAFRNNKAKINELIASILQERKDKTEKKGWKLERVLSTDRTAIKIACAEIIANPDCPMPVIIDEIISLSEKYGTENSPKFVNGVMSDISNKTNLLL